MHHTTVTAYEMVLTYTTKLVPVKVVEVLVGLCHVSLMHDEDGALRGSAVETEAI
jgi:hypothetical protein